jgi:hypothetical protein
MCDSSSAPADRKYLSRVAVTNIYLLPEGVAKPVKPCNSVQNHIQSETNLYKCKAFAVSY